MNTKPFIELPCLRGSGLISPANIFSIRTSKKSICISVENPEEKLLRLSIYKAENILIFLDMPNHKPNTYFNFPNYGQIT